MGDVRWRGIALPIGLVLAAVLFLSRTGALHRSASRATPQRWDPRATPEAGPEDPRSPAPRGSAARPEHRRKAVRVEVVDRATRRPLRAVTVEARDGSLASYPLVDSAVTDETGCVSLKTRGAGVVLYAWLRGFVPAEGWAGEEEEEAWFALEAGLPVAGRVIHPDGSAAARAELSLEYGLNQRLTLHPDESGRFEIPGLVIGQRAKVNARENGFWPVEIEFVADPEDASVEVVLGRGGTCEGRVVDEAGLPVAGAMIRIGDWNPWTGLEMASDDEGRFTARGLPEGLTCSVLASTADHRSGASEPFTCSAEDPIRRCEVVVRPHAWLAVKVTFPDGSPVVDALVRVSKDLHFHDWCIPVAATPGLFESGAVEPGEWEIQAHVDGFLSQTRVAQVLPRVRNDVQLRLEEGLAIEGIVVDREDRPVAGADVSFETGPPRADSCYVVGPAQPQARTATDERGRFRLRGLDATGTLTLEAPSYLPLVTTGQPGVPSLRLVLERRPRVVGRLDAVPGTGLLSTALGHDDEYAGIVVKVARDGRFELREVPAGQEFWLKLVAEGSSPWFFTGLKLTPDETLDLGVLRPHQGATVEGVVTGSRGEPVTGAEVSIAAAIDDMAAWRTASTDGEGHFTLSDVADVASELSVEARGYLPRTVAVARPAAAARLEIVLEVGGVLEIAGTGADVEIESLDGRETKAADTVADGMRCVTLRPGLYRIGGKTFEIRAGEVTRVNLRE